MKSDHEASTMEDDELERIRARKMETIVKAMRRGNAAAPEPIAVTDASFDGIVNEHPLFALDCWAVWCGPLQGDRAHRR
jgi:hypothetical protein